MRQIDRDVHEAYRDFERAVQLTQSYPLGKHLSLPSFQTTGNDLETVSCFQGCPRGTLGEYKTFPSAPLLRVEAAQP